MGASKELFLRMREEDYNRLTPQGRALFTYAEFRETNEWDNNKDDLRYLALKKTESKAKKATQEYLFKKRNGML